jgi:hypothetical protein
MTDAKQYKKMQLRTTYAHCSIVEKAITKEMDGLLQKPNPNPRNPI